MNLRTQHHIIDWDTAKADLNLRKHGVSFDDAATVIEDSLSLTVYDRLHSDSEDRWITIGRMKDDRIIALVHTYQDFDIQRKYVRLITARIATLRERVLYESGGYMIRDDDPDIQDEYDLTGAVRGKFHVEGAVTWIPVYLEPEIMKYFMKAAREKGVQTRDLLNEILSKEIERRESANAA